MSTLSRPFPRLQISVLERRAQSTLHKQAQIRQLFSALNSSASAIKLAIQLDSGIQPREAELEFVLALTELRELYGALDIANELDNQRRISDDKDNLERVNPHGIVYVVPGTLSLFYSSVSPLAAAIAAGNCVVLEVLTFQPFQQSQG